MKPRPPIGKDQARARNLRRKIDRGTATEIDRAWLARWETEPGTYRQQRVQRAAAEATVDTAAVFEVVCRDFAVTQAEVRRLGRTKRAAELARTVAILALHYAGLSSTQIATVIHRRRTTTANMLVRAKAGPAMLIDRALASLASLRIDPVSEDAVAGDVVLMPVVVGGAAWRYLDRMAELDEITGSAIRHRGLGLMIDHAACVE